MSMDDVKINTKVEYKGNKTKVTIGCSTCGDFQQIPNTHTLGGGCRKCFQRSDSNAIYVWRVNNTSIYKIGITSMRLGDSRIKEVARDATKTSGVTITPTIMLRAEATNALELEKYLHTLYTALPTGMPENMDGRTEFRVLEDSEVQNIINYINNHKEK